MKDRGFSLVLLAGSVAFLLWAWAKSQEPGEPDLLETAEEYANAAAGITGATLDHAVTSGRDTVGTIAAPATGLLGGADEGIGTIFGRLFGK